MKNREIEFRGMTISKNGFVFGDLTHGKGILEGRVFVMPIDEYLDPYEHHHPVYGYEVIPETVGQYTGLTDKNGKEIYEGQGSLKLTIYGLGEGFVDVIMKDGEWCIFSKSEGYAPLYEMLQNESIELQVIGNIHEKKEV